MKMSHFLIRGLAAGLCLTSLCLVVQAQGPQRSAQILQVQEKRDARAAGQRSPSLMVERMPKFLDERPGGRQTFLVRWVAPAAGIDPGALLLFEYKQRRLDGVRSLHIQYPFRVTGERESQFVIEEKAVNRGGAVYAWRVRLVYKGRLLAGSQSDLWN